MLLAQSNLLIQKGHLSLLRFLVSNYLRLECFQLQRRLAAGFEKKTARVLAELARDCSEAAARAQAVCVPTAAQTQ